MATWCRKIVVVVPAKSDQRRNPRFDKVAFGNATGSGARSTAQAAPAGRHLVGAAGSNDQVVVTIAVLLVSL